MEQEHGTSAERSQGRPESYRHRSRYVEPLPSVLEGLLKAAGSSSRVLLIASDRESSYLESLKKLQSVTVLGEGTVDPSRSYDAVVSYDFFQWCSPGEFARYFLEIHRTLKVNGTFSFTVTTSDRHSAETQSSDCFIYSIDSILKAASYSGFSLTECHRLDFLPRQTGLSQFVITMINLEQEDADVMEVRRHLSPYGSDGDTLIASTEQVEVWQQLIELCRAYNNGDYQTFSAGIRAIPQHSKKLGVDLQRALDALSLLGTPAHPKDDARGTHPLRFEQAIVGAAYERYFGLSAGGVDLLSVLRATKMNSLEKLRALTGDVLARNGRIFTMGNGGSYDNARVLAKAFGALGCRAKAAGEAESFFDGDYSQSFKSALEFEAITDRDLVIGLSGSGNSPNIVEAFKYALSIGANTFALGGRDGGQMRTVIGDELCLIAGSDCMEAIEDIHCAVGLIVGRSLMKNEPLAETLNYFLGALESGLSAATLKSVTTLAGELLKTMERGSHLYVIGSSIAANHFRADAQRGFTNALPIRGICAPELYTVNSGMATANDDGVDFLLIDGLAKYRTGPDDFALLMDLPGQERRVSIAREWLSAQGTPIVSIGGAGADIDFSRFFEQFDAEFAGSVIAHATGVVLRELLWERWKVRELTGAEKGIALNGQRKLTLSEAEELKKRLVRESVINENETITFCYGKVFAALDPSLFGLEPGYY